jgi:hypothetical protein
MLSYSWPMLIGQSFGRSVIVHYSQLETLDLLSGPIEIDRRPRRTQSNGVDNHLLYCVGDHSSRRDRLLGILRRHLSRSIGAIVSRVGKPGRPLVEDLRQRRTGDGQQPVFQRLRLDLHNFLGPPQAKQSALFQLVDHGRKRLHHELNIACGGISLRPDGRCELTDTLLGHEPAGKGVQLHTKALHTD